MIRKQLTTTMRTGLLLSFVLLANAAALPDENKYIMNFDLRTLSPAGDVVYNIQLQGIHLLAGKPFHGDDLGNYDYFFTVSSSESGKAKLTIEFYEYESRLKESDVVSEIVAEVDFILGTPAIFEGTSDTFSVDLAFSIDEN